MKKIRLASILYGFLFLTTYPVAAQFSQPGELDTTFNPNLGANTNVLTLALQPDGKVIIGGLFTSYNGTTRIRIARLNTNGSLDTSFNPGLGANDFIRTLALQPDGKVLIGGDFTTYDGVSRNSVARLNADGSLDATFNPGSGASFPVFSIAIQLDGKVLICGSFATYNGTPRNRIARLNSNGSLDTSFNPGSGAVNWISALAIQPDGKVLIGGFFSSFNGVSRNCIARLNANGSLDMTFNPGTGANADVISLALQPDGKVLIGGYFNSFNGTTQNGIARLNANGSLDATFISGTGVIGLIYSFALQPDGKVLFGGTVGSYNGISRVGITRLNPNGSLDTIFNPGAGAIEIWSFAIQPDGKVLIGGSFVSYNGTSRNRIARIWAGSGTLSYTAPEINNQTIRLYPNPTQEYLTVESKEPFRYEWYSLAGKRLKASDLTPAQAELATDFLAPGTYILKIITSKGVETRKVVKE